MSRNNNTIALVSFINELRNASWTLLDSVYNEEICDKSKSIPSTDQLLFDLRSAHDTHLKELLKTDVALLRAHGVNIDDRIVELCDEMLDMNPKTTVAS